MSSKSFPAGLTFMESLGFVDALHEKVPSSIETHRWPLWIFTLKKRLDHILYSSANFVCLDCKVVKGYEEGASDHQPVVAKFAFK